MENPAYTEDEAAFRRDPAAMKVIREAISRQLTDGFANVLSDATSPVPPADPEAPAPSEAARPLSRRLGRPRALRAVDQVAA